VNGIVNAANWGSAEFSVATGSATSGTCTVASYPTAGVWPTYTIQINGGGITNSYNALAGSVSYTVKNYGNIPIKINQVTITISTTITTGLEIKDTTSGHPLASFDYTNNSGGTTSSTYLTSIAANGTANGTISLSAPKGNGLNGKSCTVTVTFTTKPS
jgi:hypothetical protein